MDACIPYEWKQKPVEARMDEEMLAKIKGRWAEYWQRRHSDAVEESRRLRFPPSRE
jgi:hypothetical protein